MVAQRTNRESFRQRACEGGPTIIAVVIAVLAWLFLVVALGGCSSLGSVKYKEGHTTIKYFDPTGEIITSIEEKDEYFYAGRSAVAPFSEGSAPTKFTLKDKGKGKGIDVMAGQDFRADNTGQIKALDVAVQGAAQFESVLGKLIDAKVAEGEIKGRIIERGLGMIPIPGGG